MWSHLADNRRELIGALGIALVLQALFVVSYVEALSRPKPHRIPVSVVGTARGDAQFVTDLQRQVGSALSVRRVSTFGEARARLDDQDAFAIIVPGARSTRIYVDSAAGATIARVFREAAPDVGRRTGRDITVSDLRPLPDSDPQGLVVFYLALGCVIYGYVAALLSMTAAPKVPPRARAAALAGFSLLGGAVLSLLVTVLLDAIPGSFLDVAGIAALTIFTATSLTALLVHTIHALAMPVAIVVLVILGSPASGGAVAPDLLPGFFRFVGHWLPPGAAVSALRDVAYFAGHVHLRPFLVLAAWALVSTTLLLVVDRSRPATQEPA